MIQPQINGLATAGKFKYALKVLQENQKDSYGANNHLLYLLDYGLMSHLAGRYEESIKTFEEAKNVYDQLYTTSISKEVATWLINDNMAPYRGEDFERVMINIFQSLNFVALGNIEEALVEARDVDVKLSVINRQYKPDQKNVYKEDAFARLLMGILYEQNGTGDDLNDAFISYKKAVDIYENDYHIEVPEILKENILALAEWMDQEEFQVYRRKFMNKSFLGLKDKEAKAEVYLIHYAGLSPIKHQISIPIPLPGGYLSQLAFPVYDRRTEEISVGYFKAVDLDQNSSFISTEEVEDIGGIAIENLNNRKARVIAKAAIRSAGKYLIEQETEEALERKYGDNSSNWVKYVGSLYNIVSEQADLRSWQTLPDQIRMARLILDPGQYELFLNEHSFGSISVIAGEKKFILFRTVQ